MIRVVASALITQNNKVLLVREKSVDKYGLPGGKLEENETLRECAERECREEIGINIIIKRLVMISEKPLTRQNNTVVRFIYEAKAADGFVSTTPELEYNYYSQDKIEEFAKQGEIRGDDVLELIHAYYSNTIKALDEPKIFR